MRQVDHIEPDEIETYPVFGTVEAVASEIRRWEGVAQSIKVNTLRPNEDIETVFERESVDGKMITGWVRIFVFQHFNNSAVKGIFGSLPTDWEFGIPLEEM